MCTVSLVPTSGADRPGGEAGRLRLVCNRDEQRTRPQALPPLVRRFGEVLAVMPVDPVSGGTWIGVNSAGLLLCLLNATPAGRASEPPRDRRSRGLIIPELLGLTSVAEAATLCARIDPHLYPPFKMLACSTSELAVVESDGRGLRVRGCVRPSRPFVLSSSGLGDSLVARPRGTLFRSMLGPPDQWLDGQRAFHAHAWNDRPHLSIRMSRPDARTVSRTSVDLNTDRVRMEYEALNEDGLPCSAGSVLVLPLRQAVSAP